MEFFKLLIYYLAFASLGFSFAAAYLKIIKIWKRKHLRDVAESVSISGNIIDVVPLSVFALNYYFVSQWQGLIDSAVWIVAGIILIVIGTGFWVEPKNKKKSLWRLLKEALHLEKKEVVNLTKALFKPSNKTLVIDILEQIAFIDHVLDQREKTFIQTFADSWDIRIDWDQITQKARSNEQFSYQELHGTLTKYLKTLPSYEQVAELGDTITALINVDDVVTQEEALALDEIRGLFSNYIEKDTEPLEFSVVLVPQKPEHEEKIQHLLPNIQKRKIAGGSAYVVDSFFSSDYASAVCNQYQALDLFTVTIANNDIKRQGGGIS